MRNFIPSISLMAALILTSCQSTSVNPRVGDTASLNGLLAMANTRTTGGAQTSAKMGKVREMALKETALSLGAQAALAWRARAINEQLIKQARYLDTIYDFNAMMLKHNVMPPVLLEGRNTYNLANAQAIRISDRTYKVGKQAHFVSTPPTWRQYIWMDYTQPEYPDLTLLPKTRDERQIWCLYIEKGWKQGVEQANTILEENLARLKEDFNGMIIYRKLLAMNMVSAPFVADTDLGVTGDGNEIHIDDRVLRITALPALNPNSQEWRAAVATHQEALEQFTNMEKLVKQSKITITNDAWQPVIAPTA